MENTCVLYIKITSHERLKILETRIIVKKFVHAYS